MKVRAEDVQAADRYLNDPDEAFNEASTGLSGEESDAGAMDDEELGSLIAAELSDAVRFVDLEIGQERARATKAYRGDPYGDEEDGRSRIVSRDVHDTVQGQLPDILRILLGPERICEYAPMKAADVLWVEQATQYAEYVVQRDNDGFTILYSAIKDALVRKTGIVKYWWDQTEEVRTENYTEIDEMGVFLLQQDGTVEDLDITPLPVDPALPPDPQTGQPPKLFDVELKRRIKHGRIKLAALPPEEFILDRRARSLEDFTLCGHRSMKTVSELVAMGYDEEEVRTFVTSPELDMNIEYIERQPMSRAVGSFDALNPATQRVLYIECYVHVDMDGDGIAELHKVCTMGPAYKVVYREPVDHVPFADFHVDPEPHTFFGLSTYDKTADIQVIKTHMQRNLLDSLAQSIHPRTAVVEGAVNMDDVLNNEVGGVVRMRAPGMVMPLDTPFVGQQALPVLGYIDEVREMRTGVSRQSLGLGADDLQSTNVQAIEQAITGSQGKIELIARVMANGMRKLYAGILHLTVQNQDRPRIIEINGDFVPMDPRTWNSDAAVKINVALGSGTTSQKLATLGMILQKQEMIFQVMGVSQPIVTPQQYAQTLRKWVELAGYRNPDSFFSPVPEGWQPPPPQPPPPDPKVEVQKMQLQLDAQRLQFEQQRAMWQEHRERDKNVAEMLLRRREMDLRYKGTIESAAINAAGNENAAEANHHMTGAQQQHDADKQLMDHLHEMAMTGVKLQHEAEQKQLDRDTAERQAAAAAAAKSQPQGE